MRCPAAGARAGGPQKTLLARVAALPPLTSGQIESYLDQNKRNAESLLAAYRAGTNLAYLAEAASRFPTDPDVQYAVIAARAFPDAQREWIDAYKISSAESLMGMGLVLGGHLSAGGGSQTLINQLVGIAIEKSFAAQLDAAGKDPFGRPVSEVTASIAQHQATLKDLAKTLNTWMLNSSDAELANYMERVKLYGEEAAATWLKTTHAAP
jgi:hypothetical protein